MQLMRDGQLLGLTLEINWSGSDHAGPRFSVSLLFLTFDITIYDSRHWNHDAETPAEAALDKWGEQQSDGKQQPT
jgi:hypothetical protein